MKDFLTRYIAFVVLWTAGILCLVHLCSGCAHFSAERPQQQSRLLRLCGPQAVILSKDSSAEFYEAAQRAVDAWNDAAGHKLLYLLGTGWFADGEASPDDRMIEIDRLPDSAAPGHARVGGSGGPVLHRTCAGDSVVQRWSSGDPRCAIGARIRVFADAGSHPRTLEYRLKHGLGHALGLGHSWWGVMAEEMPDWLPDYYLTGGEIDRTDVNELLRMYPEVQR